MLGSDGVLNDGQGHPRAAGAFPRFLRRYVLDRPLLSLPEALAKMTCQAAQRFKLPKGTLTPGCSGDITVFDPCTLRDRATFQQPHLPPEGIAYVLLHGQLAVKDGQVIEDRAGRSVRCLPHE